MSKKLQHVGSTTRFDTSTTLDFHVGRDPSSFVVERNGSLIKCNCRSICIDVSRGLSDAPPIAFEADYTEILGCMVSCVPINMIEGEPKCAPAFGASKV